MDTFFGVPWTALDLDAVERFLSDQEDEGLTWETKGTEIRPASVLKAVCGLANQLGGFLIIGASRQNAAAWTLSGVRFPDEPRVWLSNVIGVGLDPRPVFDVHAWEASNGAHVAVVSVDPVPVPPCVTSSGQVYQRLPGKTEPVTESSILAALFQRGDRARANAETLAQSAVSDMHHIFSRPNLQLRVGVGPTGKPDDVGRILFSRTFEERLTEAFRRLPREPLLPLPTEANFTVGHTRTDVVVDGFPAMGREDAGHYWRIRCRWDGSVLVLLYVYPETDAQARLNAAAVFSDAVRPAIDEALVVATAMGAVGPAHVVVRFQAAGFHVGTQAVAGYRAFPNTTAQAWIQGAGFPAAALARWERELLRDASFRTYEPDEEVGSGGESNA